MQPDKKGDFYVALIEKPGRPAIDVIGEIVPAGGATFPWPKSMRWGSIGKPAAHLGAAAAFHRRDLRPGDRGARTWCRSRSTASPPATTRGHRFLAPAPFKVRRFDDYVAKLEKAKVVLDAERRKEIILADAKNLAFAQGFELVEDAGPARRSRRPGRMAGGADGLVRRGVPRRSRPR